MTMERIAVDPKNPITVLTADLCAALTECENHHALCKGRDRIDGTGAMVFCICWCHQKASAA